MKIIAIGMNYVAHCHELHANENLPKEPVIFMKPDSALLKDSKPFFIPDFSKRVDYETELVVRICRLGKQKLRAEGKPWEISKGFDNSAVIGDFVPVSRFKDVQNLDFHLNIDGNKVQEGNTRDMIFKIDDLIAYISQFYTLKIGDLLYTGTPVGVGPVSIGQHLEGYLEGEKLLDFYVR